MSQSSVTKLEEGIGTTKKGRQGCKYTATMNEWASYSTLPTRLIHDKTEPQQPLMIDQLLTTPTTKTELHYV